MEHPVFVAAPAKYRGLSTAQRVKLRCCGRDDASGAWSGITGWLVLLVREVGETEQEEDGEDVEHPFFFEGVAGLSCEDAQEGVAGEAKA